MALSMKRHQPMDDDSWPPLEPKKGKLVAEQPSLPPPPPIVPRVVLNPADCDLDFNVEGDGLLGSALYEEGFAYCWSGARANIGIFGGKYCFGCRIIANQPVNMDDTPWDQQNLCRVGISIGDDAVGNLGETLHSFGFGGTGKFSNAGHFSEYGERFGAGDTIICCVDLDSKPALIGFSKNGNWLGIAKQFVAGPSSLGVVDCPFKKPTWKSAVFPHILVKNVVVQMQFSVQDGLIPQEGYEPWASAVEDGKEILGPTFQSVSDCEVIMIVGLPACGKSTWAENWVKNFPEKRYVLLGTNLALDQMKVPSLLRKNNYSERFERLMDCATKIFNTLLSRASRMPRNFIIDQTNVYKSARRRKLKPFANYHKIAVVIFPKPEELKKRAEKRFQEMGKEIPAEAVNQMLVNFTLPLTKDTPYTDEYFDEVFFPELSRAESERYLDQMKKGLTLYKEVYRNPGKGSVQLYDNASPINTFEASMPSCGAPLHNYQASSHETSSIPSCGAPQLSYQANYHETSIPLYGVPHSQGSLPGHLGLGDLVNSCSVQTPFEAPLTSSFSNSPGYHLDNVRNYQTYDGHPQYGRNDAERRFAVPGGMNEQHWSCRARVSCTSTDNTIYMNEPYRSMNPVPYNPQDLYASQPQGPPPQPFIVTPPTFGSTTAQPYGPPYGTPILRPSHGNFPAR